MKWRLRSLPSRCWATLVLGLATTVVDDIGSPRPSAGLTAADRPQALRMLASTTIATAGLSGTGLCGHGLSVPSLTTAVYSPGPLVDS